MNELGLNEKQLSEVWLKSVLHVGEAQISDVTVSPIFQSSIMFSERNNVYLYLK